MQGLKRTCYCGEVTPDMTDAVVCGWTARVRDKGGIVFIDLRDRSGIVQLVFDENTEKSVFEKAKTVRGEDVLAVKGTVRERESVNSEIKTGGIEIVVSDLRILT
ncbi:MAG: Asp-tRNA(Asn)/Glu-tRNA(Gln) amidotransferase GatCAB subunit C, partial [Oscillospiraceae bacterium]|nr:Asp-tRNA(Asn)/Glu-tRNA(Gln) amidotransferase GatCAB subunit C [Oscillospiraceae bacterium]